MDEPVVLRINDGCAPSPDGRPYAKRLAAAMGWQLRDYGYCVARAAGIAAVGNAVKAIAICNHRTKTAEVTLCVEAALDRIEENKPVVVQMTIREVDFPPPKKMRTYRIAGQSDKDLDLNKLVQSLLRPLQAEEGISMHCLGPKAIYRATLAFITTRTLVQNELVMIPTWESVLDKKKIPVSLIRLDIWANPTIKS